MIAGKSASVMKPENTRMVRSEELNSPSCSTKGPSRHPQGDFTYEEAEQKVLNRLSQLAPLPGNTQPTISPASFTGEIYRYRLKGPHGFSLTDLKTLQDWVVERRFRAVPGVIDITGWGGRTKTYDVTIDLAKLQAYNLTLTQVLQVLNNSNINVGGQMLNIGPQAAVVRGVGLIRSMNEIRNTFSLRTPIAPCWSAMSPRSASGMCRALGFPARTARTTSSRGSC